ncbi:LamG domain-containing protein [Streptomyces sp. C1-2]|uniref:LamG domain-containing protein n=1 Tax=Streptomyces sp. C1-2 TaxID=2720022 RepID=UPI0014323838|nr:LamG domain-containing protein [Streptomyces sp. C1-2]NJP70685.1 LamG domain-containing protein [Streptomyces sp. C1-2]
MAYSDVVLADSPLLYYRLEETSGTTVASSGSLAVNGTATGLTLGQAGIPGTPSGKAASFDGTSSRIEAVTSNTFYNDKSWSVEAWFKCGATLANDYNTIVRRGSGGSYVLLRVRGSSNTNPNRVEAYVSTGSGSVTLITATNTVNDNAWHHVVMTADGSTIRLYLDGSQKDSKTYPAGTVAIATSQFIGAAESLSEWFSGSLDEVAFYGAALSAQRVTDHYNAGAVAPAGPLSLEAGSPASVAFAGTLGYTLEITDPVVPPLTLEAGSPAVANFAGVLGYTLEIQDGPTYRYLDTELGRKRTSVTLGSRSIDVELARKRINMEVKK